MTVRVIKDNSRRAETENELVKKPVRNFKRTCTKCQSVFEYQDTDIEDEDRGLYGPFTFVKCPCCGAELPHYNSLLEKKEIEEI